MRFYFSDVAKRSLGRWFLLVCFQAAVLGHGAFAQTSCPPGMQAIWTGAWVCAPAQTVPAYGNPGPSREDQIRAITSGATQGEMVNPMQGRVNAMAALLEAQELGGKRIQAAINADPKLKQLAQGKWEYFNKDKGGARDAGCAAAFVELRGAVLLSEVGGGHQEAAMTFIGANIPRPVTPSKISVTLDQDDGKPQTVKVLSYAVAGSSKLGALSFEVPSMTLLLDSMADKQSFDIEIDGKSVTNIEWKGGTVARDHIRRCLGATR